MMREHIEDPHALLDELARHDFVSFLIRAFPHISGGADLDPNWHLDAIAYQLEQVENGTIRRLLVTLPPRNLKSIMISVAWVAWRLGRLPTLNFVCVSYSNELSAKHARDCRAIIQSDWYRRLFPRALISQGRSAAHDFQMTAGGGRLATSIGGTLTGRGGDIIIIDDPIKPDDAASDVARQSANEWFNLTLASRLNNKRRGAIITVMQRLHQFDLAGMLIERGGWAQLSLPAIANESIVIPLTRGRKHRRLDGQVLHETRDSIDDLLSEKANVGSEIFAAQYQQNPVPAHGNMIKAEWLKTYSDDLDPSSTGGEIVQSWDTANKDGINNAYSVCVTALVQRKTVSILHVWRRRVPFHELVKAAVTLACEHKARVLLIEDQASGEQLLTTLRSESPPGLPMPIARRPDADKKTRLSGVSSMIEAGQLLLPSNAGWLAEFKQELLAFPSSRYADQVDALSQLLSWVRGRHDDVQETGSPILYDGDNDTWIGDTDFDDSPWFD